MASARALPCPMCAGHSQLPAIVDRRRQLPPCPRQQRGVGSGAAAYSCMTGINELSVWKAVDVHFVQSILLAIGGGVAMEKVYFSLIRGSRGLWLGGDIYPSIKDLNVCIDLPATYAASWMSEVWRPSAFERCVQTSWQERG
mmetsp:Transcript_22956/g.65666  ORF Transcript_22956/g.65666 Transcript_22956/m.65666 type:complete len:142 (-) Transcript_22956:1329-1754(-)